jgi:hypothetical protein
MHKRIKRYQAVLILTLIVVLWVTSCQTTLRLSPSITPQIKPSRTETSTHTPDFTLTPSPTEATPTPNATQEVIAIADAQEAVEAYYHLMEEKQYAEAYSLLSPRKSNLQPLDEWVEDCEIFFESIELLSVQHYPYFARTLIATIGDQRISTSIYESSHCKIFVVTKDVDYIGGWGAGPSGVYNENVIVIKEDGSWRLVEISPVTIPDACSRYD